MHLNNFVIILWGDHSPWLQTKLLSNGCQHKNEGLLCRWSLALQEYDFQIRYCKSTQSSNADALSQCIETQPAVPSAPIVILPHYSVEQLKLCSPTRRSKSQTTSDSIE